jgi:hypothetical protein
MGREKAVLLAPSINPPRTVYSRRFGQRRESHSEATPAPPSSRTGMRYSSHSGGAVREWAQTSLGVPGACER